MALIGLKITRPAINLNTTLPKVDLQVQEPRLDITSPRPRIRIDQTQCFADAGRRGLLDFALTCSDYSRSQFSEGLDKIVSDGNNLAAIQTGFSIADLGVEAMESDQHIFEIKAIPQQPPVIEADIQPVSFRFSRGKVEVNVRAGKIDNQFQRGKVEAYLAQRNFLDIKWIDDHQVDKTV